METLTNPKLFNRSVNVTLFVLSVAEILLELEHPSAFLSLFLSTGWYNRLYIKYN